MHPPESVTVLLKVQGVLTLTIAFNAERVRSRVQTMLEVPMELARQSKVNISASRSVTSIDHRPKCTYIVASLIE